VLPQYETFFIVLTDIFAATALHVERVVALLLVGVAVLEQKAVRAELGLGHVVDALVVEITLLRVGEEPVGLGAPERR
jgi:hypothetical protein